LDFPLLQDFQCYNLYYYSVGCSARSLRSNHVPHLRCGRLYLDYCTWIVFRDYYYPPHLFGDYYCTHFRDYYYPLICMGIITVFHFRDYYYPPISGIIPPPPPHGPILQNISTEMDRSGQK
jgi:hypothetical protein